MSLSEQLKERRYQEIWDQYCGFLDLSMEEYMNIQRRLMEEQIQLWSNCELGRSILKGKKIGCRSKLLCSIRIVTRKIYFPM